MGGPWTTLRDDSHTVRDKLARYRRARLANLVLCVDEALACADSALPENARVVRFH